MNRPVLNKVRAFGYGIIDGWQQPSELNSSRNVDHLCSDDTDSTIFETLDQGINLGQFLRAGFRSESWLRGYPILGIRRPHLTKDR